MMQRGEKYQCTNDECGCEISVTKSSEFDGGTENPKCCCGDEMELIEAGARGSAGRGGRTPRQELPR